MPKGLGLYFTAVFSSSSSFLFFRRQFSQVTKRIWTKFGRIFTYDCYLKNLVQTPPGIYHGLGAKKRFSGTNFELWPNISLQRNTISTIGKNLSMYRDSQRAPKFGELWSRNDWEQLDSFCSTPKFSHRKTLPALPHGRYITDSS